MAKKGINGTPIHKRDGFLRMMLDVKGGRFDLIFTREVSRFARNVVDTLQQTRLLKSYGVEVWFTEDNTWTLNHRLAHQCKSGEASFI